ncbi:MAG: group II intron reverse transcriptase domain-containing protein [Methyloprofundus sp.]|nr:group II intron reverse transcriptase domain-containing protein [Methyloprofundus sp.]
MGKKYRNLIGDILNDDNFRLAYYKASIGKKSSSGYLNFKEKSASRLAAMRSAINHKTYKPGEPREFWVYEPKPRPITAMPFGDRVVQHALVNILMPIFEKGFMPQSYACRKGRGMHSGAIRTQAIMRRLGKGGKPVYALKTDFSKYFYSISREVLWRLIEKKISCQHTIWLIEQFTPRNGYGLPIGNLTSQLWANVIGNEVDRFLVHRLKINNFTRYMDDIVILHNSRLVLESMLGFIEWFCNYRMRLFFSKQSIQNINRGVNFLGYRIWPTHKLLRKDSVRRAKRKIKLYTKNQQWLDLEKFKASFAGHAKWADSYNLIRHLEGVEICSQN